MKTNCNAMEDCWIWAFMTKLNPSRLAHFKSVRRLLLPLKELPDKALLPILHGLTSRNQIRPLKKYSPKKYKPDSSFIDEEEEEMEGVGEERAAYSFVG